MPLDIHLRIAQPLELEADVLVVGVTQVTGKTPAIGPSLKPLDAALGGALAKLVEKEEFTGKRDQVLSLATLGKIPSAKVVVLGLGDRRALGAPTVRTSPRRRRASPTEKRRRRWLWRCRQVSRAISAPSARASSLARTASRSISPAIASRSRSSRRSSSGPSPS
jgi:hypothetical protein